MTENGRLFSWIRVLPLGVSVSVIGISMILGLAGIVPTPKVKVTWSSNNEPQSYIPVPADIPGPELVMVYLGSSSCVASNGKELPELIEDVKLALRNLAWEHGYMFSAVGVAVDSRVSAGLNHLGKFGTFDEVMTGRSWLGAGSRKYFFEDLPGAASTPQILVYRRDVHISTPENLGVLPSISGQSVILRKSGANAIMDWFRRGLPMSMEAFTESASSDLVQDR